MAKEKPIIQPDRPDKTTLQQESVVRGIISPCTGCKQAQEISTTGGICPKRVFYEQKKIANETNEKTYNYNAPPYQEELRSINPVWPGVSINNTQIGNNYAYVYLALYEDNVDNNHNPEWDTAKIRCRGPYLFGSPERHWNFLGRPEQGDHVLGLSTYYFIDGVPYQGFAFESASYQVSTGYTRKVDSNLGSTLSGAE